MLCSLLTVISYAPIDNLGQAGQLAKGILDFLCLDLPLVPSSGITDQFIHLPIAGAAVVPAYNIGSLLGDHAHNETNLVFDGETLAMIFMGNITTWDHPFIQELNPNITLPHANITIGVSPGSSTLGQTDVFKRALSLFSSEFASALESAGNDFQKMAPAQQGHAFIASDGAARLRFVQVSNDVLSLSLSLCKITLFSFLLLNQYIYIYILTLLWLTIRKQTTA